MHLNAARPEEDTDLYENKRAPFFAPFPTNFLPTLLEPPTFWKQIYFRLPTFPIPKPPWTAYM